MKTVDIKQYRVLRAQKRYLQQLLSRVCSELGEMEPIEGSLERLAQSGMMRCTDCGEPTDMRGCVCGSKRVDVEVE